MKVTIKKQLEKELLRHKRQLIQKGEEDGSTISTINERSIAVNNFNTAVENLNLDGVEFYVSGTTRHAKTQHALIESFFS